MVITRFKHLVATALLTTLAGVSHATIVQMQTSFGEIEVNLFDENTPATVANFLSYVDDTSYDNTLVHRSLAEFITQSGGYYLDDALTLSSVTRKASVINEPVYSNVRGTIAMAKLSCSPNSATSEWFINLNDNSANLDTQNSGFTVFGQVTENGMAVLDAIAALPTFNLGNPLTSTPLTNYTQEDSENSNTLVMENFVFIESIRVVDTNVGSAALLEPALNTLIANGDDGNCDTDSDSGGGAPSGGFLILMLGLLALGRRTK